MDMTNLSGTAAIPPAEDLLAYAAGYLQQIIDHHDGLAARIDEQVATDGALQFLAVGKLRRQLRIQVCLVEAATEIVGELMMCDSIIGGDPDYASLVAHLQQLLDEICGLADQAVPV